MHPVWEPLLSSISYTWVDMCSVVVMVVWNGICQKTPWTGIRSYRFWLQLCPNCWLSSLESLGFVFSSAKQRVHSLSPQALIACDVAKQASFSWRKEVLMVESWGSPLTFHVNSHLPPHASLIQRCTRGAHLGHLEMVSLFSWEMLWHCQSGFVFFLMKEMYPLCWKCLL